MAEMFLHEENMRAFGCLIHRDSESILAHWKTSERYMNDVMEYSNPKRVDIFGQPDDTVVKRL